MRHSLAARILTFILYVGLTSLSLAAEQSHSRIRLEVLEPKDRVRVIYGFPVSVGLIFPEGELSTIPGGRVVDDGGRPVPFVAEAIG
jgi:hypothetical protein